MVAMELKDLSEYTQIFHDDDGTKSNANLFLAATTNGKILFQNPHPSSTGFCRPLHIQYAKETTELTLQEKRNIDSKIADIKLTVINRAGLNIVVNFKLFMTMDGCVYFYKIITTMLIL